jgi:hypothetical protein
MGLKHAFVQLERHRKGLFRRMKLINQGEAKAK